MYDIFEAHFSRYCCYMRMTIQKKRRRMQILSILRRFSLNIGIIIQSCRT